MAARHPAIPRRRYHHLFADVLRARLYQQGTARASELHKRAAAWFDSQEIGEEAVNHALASGDLQLAAPYIERYADLQWKLGEQQTSERWLTSLPDEIVLSSPKLCTELGRILLMNFRFDALRKLLDACRIEELSEDSIKRDFQGRILGLEAYFVRTHGEYERALELSIRAISCLAEDNI